MTKSLLFLVINRFYFIIAQDYLSALDSLCPCDLTPTSCDVNCCCDLYCSSEDRLVFTECINYEIRRDTKSCFSPSTIVFNSTDYPTDFQGGLLCIYYDNNRQRNYYIQPTLVDRINVFEEYKSNYGTESFESEPFISEDLQSISDYYQLGDPMFTVDEEYLIANFIVPQPVLTDYCNYNTPAGFLRQIDVTCLHSTKDLAYECTRAWHFNAQRYQDFSLLKSPAPLAVITGHKPVGNTSLESEFGPESLPDLVQNERIPILPSTEALNQKLQQPPAANVPQPSGEVGNGTAEADNTTVVPTAPPATAPTRGPPPAPSWDGRAQTCRNVAVNVHYEIVLGEGGHITGSAVDIRFDAVNTSTPAFARRFSIKFRWNNDSTDNFRRSGNPGYIVGLPVMAGELMKVNDTEVINLDNDNTRWLTMMAPMAHGSCSRSAPRLPILFGQNMLSGCLIEISSLTNADQCNQMRIDVLQALEGQRRDRIAVYGNVSAERTADWVQILPENDPQLGPARAPTSSRTGTCPNMVLGVHYEILYAYTGSASKPQAKIVGAKMRFLQPRTIAVRCIGPHCSVSTSNLTQKIPVIASVTFIDVSEPAQPMEADIPTFNARLPYDFFYPFSGVSSAPCIRMESLVIVFAFVLCMLIPFLY